ncbi:MAG: MotA/TolQ/ExbB proton channel family protein [Alphaproteobacteria bacterium]|nr:MotA/TolQ/ExbB proton channel family protein [Alphaproteobacteria bacterium]
MSDAPPTTASPAPNIRIESSQPTVDLATVLGLVFAVGLIVIAIAMGQSDASFFNVPSLLIVLLGTLAATAISYSGEELANAGNIIAHSIVVSKRDPAKLAEALLDTAVLAKSKGILSLASFDREFAKDAFLKNAVQLVMDGYEPKDIDFFLTQEIDAESERQKRSAGITRRASEVAPSMGLIGTLVGLVQMLADLENPETIGPAMAVALLTTFYGAILGTIVMAPLAVKLEKRHSDSFLIKTMIKLTAVSLARQDNPRKLEMLLNAELPAAKRIRYFD